MVCCYAELGTPKCATWRSLVFKLHWLPVWLSFELKVTTLVHQVMSENDPRYLDDDYLHLLRKTPFNWHLCASVSQTWTNFGDRDFSAAGPRVWNYLQTNLRQPDSKYLRFTHCCKHDFIWEMEPKCSASTSLTVLYKYSCFHTYLHTKDIVHRTTDSIKTPNTAENHTSAAANNYNKNTTVTIIIHFCKCSTHTHTLLT